MSILLSPPNLHLLLYLHLHIRTGVENLSLHLSLHLSLLHLSLLHLSLLFQRDGIRAAAPLLLRL